MEYKLVLGMEIHLHVKTATKMFCGCDANIYGDAPNSHVCPTCMGLPGALPVPNLEAVKQTQRLGMALGCKLNSNSKFDRKHYFYPDLPKGYQISQYKQPLCEGGRLALDSGREAILERIHLEEDTAKSFHEHGQTLIDFNKSGMPLIEIVTTPCFHYVEDAVDFCKKIQELIVFMGVGDGDMEKGQLRLEANISIRTPEMAAKGELPNYKVEVKNINSFKFMEKAVKAEMNRQAEILDAGGKVAQENRGFNEVTGKTVPQRDKEEAHDYRYFPEPDIPPMVFDGKHIDAIKASIGELPWERKAKLEKQGLNPIQAVSLASIYNENLYKTYIAYTSAGLDPKGTANLLINRKETRGLDLEAFKKLLDQPSDLLPKEELSKLADDVITTFPDIVAQIKSGKEAAIEFLVGQVMKLARGKADPVLVRSALKDKLIP